MTHAFPSLASIMTVSQFFLRLVDVPGAPPLLVRLVVEDKLEELRSALEEDTSEIEKDCFGFTPVVTAAHLGHVESRVPPAAQ